MHGAVLFLVSVFRIFAPFLFHRLDLNCIDVFLYKCRAATLHYADEAKGEKGVAHSRIFV